MVNYEGSDHMRILGNMKRLKYLEMGDVKENKMIDIRDCRNGEYIRIFYDGSIEIALRSLCSKWRLPVPMKKLDVHFKQIKNDVEMQRIIELALPARCREINIDLG